MIATIKGLHLRVAGTLTKLVKDYAGEAHVILYDGYLCDLYLSPNFDERVKQYYEEVYRSSNNTSD